MLARTDEAKKARRAARNKRWRDRRNAGLTSLTVYDLDPVAVEFFLEEAGLLPAGVDHIRKDVERAWTKYVHLLLNPQA